MRTRNVRKSVVTVPGMKIKHQVVVFDEFVALFPRRDRRSVVTRAVALDCGSQGGIEYDEVSPTAVPDPNHVTPRALHQQHRLIDETG